MPIILNIKIFFNKAKKFFYRFKCWNKSKTWKVEPTSGDIRRDDNLVEVA